MSIIHKVDYTFSFHISFTSSHSQTHSAMLKKTTQTMLWLEMMYCVVWKIFIHFIILFGFLHTRMLENIYQIRKKKFNKLLILCHIFSVLTRNWIGWTFFDISIKLTSKFDDHPTWIEIPQIKNVTIYNFSIHHPPCNFLCDLRWKNNISF